MAGNNIHYELSIISTTRADSSANYSHLEHTLIDPSILFGVNIRQNKFGYYEEEVVKGTELTITVPAKNPTIKNIEKRK